MSWKEEHGGGYDVPAFIEWLVLKGVLVDNSWHNDSSPRFDVVGKSETHGVTLWVEHPLQSMRESLEKRFLATEGEFVSGADEELLTDDLEEALRFVFEHMGKYLVEPHPYLRKFDMELSGEELLQDVIDDWKERKGR